LGQRGHAKKRFLAFKRANAIVFTGAVVFTLDHLFLFDSYFLSFLGVSTAYAEWKRLIGPKMDWFLFFFHSR
jgi:hypothetical protein